MLQEATRVEEFANAFLSDARPGFHTDADVPAMVTPVTPSVVTYVVQGSTICLIC